jgi:hypothetical protein
LPHRLDDYGLSATATSTATASTTATPTGILTASSEQASKAQRAGRLTEK